MLSSPTERTPAKRPDSPSLALCLLLVMVCAFAELRGETQGDDPAKETKLEDLVNIDFRADLRVFTVMAALNAAGFDYERSRQEMSQARQALREQLKDLEPSLLSRLTSFYESHRSGPEEAEQQVAYISLALLLSDPPTFTLKDEEEAKIPDDVLRIQSFAQLVEEFYRVARIEGLWLRFQDLYRAESQAYRPLMLRVIQDILRYFRIGPRRVLNREIILIPDLLNAKDLVNVRNVDRTYYVVIGPTDDPVKNYSSLQHEYLHVLIDPLVEKFSAQLGETKKILKLAHSQPQLKKAYRDSVTLIVTESLIESIALRLRPPSNLGEEMLRLFREGSVLVPRFYRELVSYEEGRMLSFPTYAEFLLQSVDGASLEGDVKRMADIEARIQEKERKEAEAQLKAQQAVKHRNRLNSLLSESGKLISEEKFEAARQKLGELLREDPGNGNAYFYLGQIADQVGELQDAYEHYQQASQTVSNPPWIRAWSLVRMGKFLAFQDQFDQARLRFEEALKFEGELRGARVRAEEALIKLPRRE